MILKQLSIFYGIFLGNSMFVLISNNSMMSLVKKPAMSTSSDLSLTVFLSYANMHFKMWDQGFALLFCRIKDYSLITWIKMKLSN